MTVYEAELVVERREFAADGVLALTLRHPLGEPLPVWEPGAHIDVVLGPGLERQYSLCGDPADRSAWRIAVLREPDGRGGSAHVHEQVGQGDKVRVRGPRNNFALEPAPRYRFVAGGIGITPILPMLAAAEAAGAEWTLLYGGRTRRSMAFGEELARYGDRVTIAPEDETGLLDLPSVLDDVPEGTLVYCCGPGRCWTRSRSAARPRCCASSGSVRRSRRPVATPGSRWSWRAAAGNSPWRRTCPYWTPCATPGSRCSSPVQRAPAAPVRPTSSTAPRNTGTPCSLLRSGRAGRR
ncbi:putative Phenoxybenzoate dioxygenase subunit beta [Streptomyces afghaniensis 772]|uniref:Putative Phenoxybenzoate dioxygenase subunit beta n=1 Tax=Streptomyces afghaniensis 772 TaxID=1283301 RepID=S4MS59_9ACTN|nr:putative Phenoxybenzoate dioxygenase subunit beta [Streptomyces afghaniensis 772]